MIGVQNPSASLRVAIVFVVCGGTSQTAWSAKRALSGCHSAINPYNQDLFLLIKIMQLLCCAEIFA